MTSASRAIALGAARGKWMRMADGDKALLETASGATFKTVCGAIESFVVDLSEGGAEANYAHENEGGSYIVPLPQDCDPWTLLVDDRDALRKKLAKDGWDFTFYADLEEKRHCVWLWLREDEDDV